MPGAQPHHRMSPTWPVGQRRLTGCAAVATAVAMAVVAAGCEGPRSALDPAGAAAEQIAELFYWMVGGAVVIWVVVVGLAIFAIASKRAYHERTTRTLVIGGGVAFPTVVLAVLLCFSLPGIPELTEPAPPGSTLIEVHGVRWWWRVIYREPKTQQVEDVVATSVPSAFANPETAPSDVDEPTTAQEPVDEPARLFELANEIWLPVGRPVEFRLASEDVIHSFWIPSLGGKLDMIPGRFTRLKLQPTRIGTFYGVCAEYCGEAHTQMAFVVRVVSQEEYERWLQLQSEPAKEPESAVLAAGRDLFFSQGCSACHTIRGTAADGRVGPDLTHVGSRMTLGAGVAPVEVEELHRWLVATDEMKQGVLMPSFPTLTDEQADSLARYLESLE